MPGSVDVDRAGAARWLRAGAARSEVGESPLASDRSGAPGSFGVARVGAARWLRAGAARREVESPHWLWKGVVLLAELRVVELRQLDGLERVQLEARLETLR